MIKKGKIIFTVEIFIAVVLIALLWWGAGYKMQRLKTEAQARLTERNLVRIGDGIIVYRGDHEGRCPQKLEDLIPRYLERIPLAYSRGGESSAAIKNAAGYASAFDGKGGWIYITEPSDKDYCAVFANTN